MTSILQRAPATEPISTDMLRDYLRLNSDQKPLLGSLIASARLMVEAHTGLRLITQYWTEVITSWPKESIRLGHWPVRELRSVSLLGDPIVALDVSRFRLQANTRPAQIFTSEGAWPQMRASQHGASFELKVGYGDSPSDVPEALLQAVLLLAAHWYESHEWNDHASVNLLPSNVTALIHPYKNFRI